MPKMPFKPEMEKKSQTSNFTKVLKISKEV